MNKASLTLLIVAAFFPVLAASPTFGQQAAPATKKVLLLGQSPDNHPPGTHEYLPGMQVLAKCLEGTPNLKVQVVQADGDWPAGPALLREADGAVLFVSEGARWIHAEPRRLEAFAQLAARGGGLVVLHWGMGTRDAQYIDGFLKLFGGCHGGLDRKYKVLQTGVTVVDPEHPIISGIASFDINEEFYYKLKFIRAEQSPAPILTAKIDGAAETVAWAWTREDGGRSFGFSGGHFHTHWRREEYRRLMAQAVLWSAKLPVPKDGLKVEISDADLKLEERAAAK